MKNLTHNSNNLESWFYCVQNLFPTLLHNISGVDQYILSIYKLWTEHRRQLGRGTTSKKLFLPKINIDSLQFLRHHPFASFVFFLLFFFSKKRRNTTLKESEKETCYWSLRGPLLNGYILALYNKALYFKERMGLFYCMSGKAVEGLGTI